MPARAMSVPARCWCLSLAPSTSCVICLSLRPGVRLICWFPPDTGTAVVALFAADKARLGDVFYDGVAARADPLVDQWKRETAYEEKP
jgi:hypothetical protein